MTKRRVIETTDGKYIGVVFDDTKPLVSSDGIKFTPTKIQDLGDGLIRFSNAHYVVLTKEITNE